MSYVCLFVCLRGFFIAKLTILRLCRARLLTDTLFLCRTRPLKQLNTIKDNSFIRNRYLIFMNQFLEQSPRKLCVWAGHRIGDSSHMHYRKHQKALLIVTGNLLLNSQPEVCLSKLFGGWFQLLSKIHYV